MITISTLTNPRQCELEIELLVDTYIDMFNSGTKIEARDIVHLLITVENLNYDTSHILNYKASVIKSLYVERLIINNVMEQKLIEEKNISDIGRYINGLMKESLS